MPRHTRLQQYCEAEAEGKKKKKQKKKEKKKKMKKKKKKKLMLYHMVAYAVMFPQKLNESQSTKSAWYKST